MSTTSSDSHSVTSYGGLLTPPDSPNAEQPQSPASSISDPWDGFPCVNEYYTFFEKIGNGGYGEVWKAERTSDGKNVAVKMIPKRKMHPHRFIKVQFCEDSTQPGLAFYGNSVQMVPVEVYALRRIVSDGVVSFIDIFEDDSFFFLVMEYHGSPWKGALIVILHLIKKGPTPVYRPSPQALPVSSSDLYQCLEEHRQLPEVIARYCFAQLIDTVQTLLDHGIIHCDLKDQNMCIDRNWKVKLVDFGSAIIFDPETMRPPLLKGLVGTRRFSAPEVLLDQWYDPVVAEVWSLGIILSILLTGDIPFSSEAGVKAGERPLPKCKIPAEARDLMGRCLETDPTQRIRLADLRHHPWLRSAFQTSS
ncbi:kinase-like protein [Meredithblackwellia eburnea MCA 4105]